MPVLGSTSAQSGAVPVTTVASSGATQTITMPAHGEASIDMTLTANCTLTLSGGTASEEVRVNLYIHQDATGNRAITWPASAKFPAGKAPILSGAASALDAVQIVTKDGGTTYYVALAGYTFA